MYKNLIKKKHTKTEAQSYTFLYTFVILNSTEKLGRYVKEKKIKFQFSWSWLMQKLSIFLPYKKFPFSVLEAIWHTWWCFKTQL